jgi:hypothetical protein
MGQYIKKLKTTQYLNKMAVAKNQIVIAELLKQYKDMDMSFLSDIKSMDDKVNNDVIDFNEIGADPAVLIDNAVYPIASNQRTDDKRPVALHKFDTVNTIITDDELFALGYDKKSSVMAQHKDALVLATMKLGAWSLAPAADAADTPVIQTTGAVDGIRKRMIIADIIALKSRCDALQIPLESRILTLSSEHVNDILLIDQAFRDRYHNTATGKIISNIAGFKIYESLHTPKYVAAFTKKAYGAAAIGTDKNASIFHSTVNAMKATGSLKMYAVDASQDPDNRQTKVGFRMYNIVSSVNTKGIGAIVSGS